jgi:anti-anti-sigma factor
MEILMIASASTPTGEYVFSVANGQLRDAVSQLSRRFADQAPASGTAIRLDLNHVDFVGSEDLGALVNLNKRLRAAGAQLALVNVQPVVSQVLTLTRLDTILKVENRLMT